MSADRFQDLRVFHEKVARSLAARAELVRSLIGGSHWPSDGAYTEGLVRELVASAIPDGVSVGHGFGIRRYRGNDMITPQLDVVVFASNLIAPIFRDGDFVVAHAATILAAIEVKTNITSTNLRKTLDDLTKVREIATVGSGRGGALEPLEAVVAIRCRVSRKLIVRLLADHYRSKCWDAGATHATSPSPADLPDIMRQADDDEPDPQLHWPFAVPKLICVLGECPMLAVTGWAEGSTRMCPVVWLSEPRSGQEAEAVHESLASLLSLVADTCLLYKCDGPSSSLQAHRRYIRDLRPMGAMNLGRPFALLPTSTEMEAEFPDLAFVT